MRACDGGAEPPGPQEEMVRIALTSTSVFSAAVFGEEEAVHGGDGEVLENPFFRGWTPRSVKCFFVRQA